MSGRTYLFTGGYTEPIRLGTGKIVQGRCRGIATYAFDPEAGTLERLACATDAANPSFVLADPRGPYLYCANELKEHGGVGGSTASAYAIAPETGELRLLNRQPTCGEDACFLCLSPDGGHLIAANYSGGSFCAFPIDADHRLGAATCLFKHAGTGPHPLRQASPHPHQAILAPGGECVYVTDLGLDRMKCYRADWQSGWLTPCPERDIPGLPGQGLRHAAFRADGSMLYAVTELSCEVNAYRYDPATGAAELAQRVPLRANATRESLGAAIRIHPSGRWLYCSLRGEDCVCRLDIAPDGGLRLAQRESTCGATPRDIALDPSGGWLLAANQDSDSICAFRIDPGTGHLHRKRLIPDAPCVTTLSFWRQ